MESAPLTPENPASHDAVLIAACHTCIDHRFLAAHARLGVAPPPTSYPGGKLMPG